MFRKGHLRAARTHNLLTSVLNEDIRMWKQRIFRTKPCFSDNFCLEARLEDFSKSSFTSTLKKSESSQDSQT